MPDPLCHNRPSEQDVKNRPDPREAEARNLKDLFWTSLFCLSCNKAVLSLLLLTSDPQVSVPRSIYGHQVNGLNVVAVDDLQLLPRDWSGLSLQKIQTCDESRYFH